MTKKYSYDNLKNLNKTAADHKSTSLYNPNPNNVNSSLDNTKKQ